MLGISFMTLLGNILEIACLGYQMVAKCHDDICHSCMDE